MPRRADIAGYMVFCFFLMLAGRTGAQERVTWWRVIKLDGHACAILTPQGWLGNRYWHSVGDLHEGGVAVARELNPDLMESSDTNRWMLLDATGAPRSEKRYDHAQSFTEGLARVKSGGRYGFIDSQEKWVIRPVWEAALGFQSGLCPVAKNGKWGYMDRSGKLVIAPKWDQARAFPTPESPARVQRGICGGLSTGKGRRLFRQRLKLCWRLKGRPRL